MTEAEWLTCADPQRMLEFLESKTSDRKLRLFAIACCHRVWELLDDPPSRDAIEMAEWFVEGRITAAELQEASLLVDGNFLPDGEVDRVAEIAASASCSQPRADRASYNTARLKARAQNNRPQGRLDTQTINNEHLAHCGFVRDIFGNPFRPKAIDPNWLTSTVVGLAQGIYEDCAFDRMPILADALEDAGCTNADLLAHCRLQQEHARGCWAVDLLLGKQ